MNIRKGFFDLVPQKGKDTPVPPPGGDPGSPLGRDTPLTARRARDGMTDDEKRRAWIIADAEAPEQAPTSAARTRGDRLAAGLKQVRLSQGRQAALCAARAPVAAPSAEARAEAPARPAPESQAPAPASPAPTQTRPASAQPTAVAADAAAAAPVMPASAPSVGEPSPPQSPRSRTTPPVRHHAPLADTAPVEAAAPPASAAPTAAPLATHSPPTTPPTTPPARGTLRAVFSRLRRSPPPPPAPVQPAREAPREAPVRQGFLSRIGRK